MTKKNECKLFQEQSFHIIKNENQLFIIISNYQGAPKNPEIIYDGKDHAIFYKNKEISILLDYINPAIRKDLLKTESVTIIETKEKNNKIISVLEYPVKIRSIKTIPINEKLITPEKILLKYKKTMDKNPSLKQKN